MAGSATKKGAKKAQVAKELVDSFVDSAIDEAKAPPGAVPATPRASTPIQEGSTAQDPMDFDITSSQEGKKIISSY
jgi:hypothetical protein